MNRFVRDDRGTIVLLAAAGMGVFVMFVSLVLNVARAYNLQAGMSQAADAAATAGAVKYSQRDSTDEQVKKAAEKYYKANISERRSPITPNDITVNPATNTVAVRPVSTIPVYFRLLPKLRVAVNAVAVGAKPEPNKPTEISLVLDVTTSMAANNKMQGMKDAASLLVAEVLDTNPNATISLVPFNITVRFDTRFNYRSWLNSDHLSLRDRAAALNNDRPVPWQGCIINNLPPADVSDVSWKQKKLIPLNDDIAGAQEYFGISAPLSLAQRRAQQRHYAGGQKTNSLFTLVEDDGERNTDNPNSPPPSSGGGKPSGPPPPQQFSPDDFCLLPAMQSLTNQKSTLLQQIAAFNLKGYGNQYVGSSGTIGSFGMLWGWRQISPVWRGEWFGTDASRPADYKQSKKAIVFLTDGLSEMPFVYQVGNGQDWRFGFGAYGYPVYTSIYQRFSKEYNWNKYGFGIKGTSVRDFFSADLVLDDRLRQVCDNIKLTEGVDNYVIGFDVLGQPGGAERADKVLAYCASSPDKYFLAATNDQLKEVFKKIAEDILFDPNVRLVE